MGGTLSGAGCYFKGLILVGFELIIVWDRDATKDRGGVVQFGLYLRFVYVEEGLFVRPPVITLNCSH